MQVLLEDSVSSAAPPNPSVLIAMNLAGALSAEARELLADRLGASDSAGEKPGPPSAPPQAPASGAEAPKPPPCAPEGKRGSQSTCRAGPRRRPWARCPVNRCAAPSLPPLTG